MIARANRHSGWRTRSGREGLGAAKAATAMRLFIDGTFFVADDRPVLRDYRML
jgi:hypothetical protein